MRSSCGNKTESAWSSLSAEVNVFAHELLRFMFAHRWAYEAALCPKNTNVVLIKILKFNLTLSQNANILLAVVGLRPSGSVVLYFFQSFCLKSQGSQLTTKPNFIFFIIFFMSLKFQIDRGHDSYQVATNSTRASALASKAK
jgi:hypothetical protein